VRIAALPALAVCVIATTAVQADELNFAAYQRTAEDREDSCWHIRYSKCDGVVRTDDLVFVFPRAEFQRARVVVKQIQTAWNRLREMTGINPVKTFGQRVVIGFRHPSDDGGRDCDPVWSFENGWKNGFPNESWPFINIPWSYRKRRQEPEECLTIQIPHAFLAAKPLRQGGAMWAEGMCDVLSLPLCRVVELPIVCESRYQLYLSSAWQEGILLPYQDYAGRLIRWSQRNKVDARNAKELKKVLPQLWEMELASTLAQSLSRRAKSVPAGAGSKR
jgi:hypothetical protein